MMVLNRDRFVSRVFFIAVAILVVLILSSENASAFWLWSPKTKKLINPKYVVKDTPREQFDYGMSFFNNKDFIRAAEEFVRLTEFYKDSDIAPEAQYYAARSYQEAGKYYFAYQNYQSTIEKYPYTKRLNEIIEQEYNIANIFQEKGSPKLMSLELNIDLERAITIYKSILDNSAFGEYSDKALSKMAECYKRSRRYKEAMDAYNRLITDYPNSSLAGEARYQLAYTAYEASLDPEYDQGNTVEALNQFEKISQTTPMPKLANEADKAITVLRNRKAESMLKIVSFYEKQGKYSSAAVYCQNIIDKYPETQSAKIAENKIKFYESKTKKSH
ncbi:Outer membrane assembly lipoprotein YfiO [Candidatus Omnitrophus magneticus]|uniref:Outer membrane assembly lipoprotein YfiO n=1 Tax=Candidatus Omnitrophus magneticus TaxID=1609969 RepID=A0A0F0CQF8_9BACT|nr:Outer membrane assembly lipoprotein YfiO [Candidatus Omnitrophus magneticus]